MNQPFAQLAPVCMTNSLGKKHNEDPKNKGSFGVFETGFVTVVGDRDHNSIAWITDTERKVVDRGTAAGRQDHLIGQNALLGLEVPVEDVVGKVRAEEPGPRWTLAVSKKLRWAKKSSKNTVRDQSKR